MVESLKKRWGEGEAFEKEKALAVKAFMALADDEDKTVPECLPHEAH